MSIILCVHGIGQQLKGEDVLRTAWVPALRDGIRRAGLVPPEPEQVSMAFYGHLFRQQSTKSFGIPPYDETDIEQEWEKAMLEAWWIEAGRVDLSVPAPTDETKLRTPRVLQRALSALSRSRFFADLALNVFIADLKQVYAYLHDDEVRSAAQSAIESAVTEDTRVIVAHSLGSIVAYEALCANPKWPIRMLVTLGSPLGIQNLIFQRLRPAPLGNSGVWPGPLATWTNIADAGDVVALEKKLAGWFGARVQDHLVHNGATAHDVSPYLTAAETGAAIASGIHG